MAEWSWQGLRRDYLTVPLLLRAIPVGVVIAAGVLATTWTHELLSDHQNLVVFTYEAIDTTKDVLIGLDDAETGQRGYLLSGDRRYLAPYSKALDRLTHLRTALKDKLSGNAEQLARFERLDGLIDEKLGELATSIGMRDTNPVEVVARQEVAEMERATMDRIREVIGDITRGEKAILAARQADVDEDERRIRIVAILIGFVSFLTRAGVEVYIARKERQDRGAAARDVAA